MLAAEVLGVVRGSIAVNLLLRPLIPVMCVTKEEKVSLKETSGHARLQEWKVFIQAASIILHRLRSLVLYKSLVDSKGENVCPG